ncbi:MAG: hypothetical protein C0514_05760 [Candidatus Puniceispirillum sp.]|nr:hypothetical protein [Candidatus Puniceispirillum sp.]
MIVMRFVFFVLFFLYHLPVWSTASDDAPTRPLTKAGLSTSAPPSLRLRVSPVDQDAGATLETPRRQSPSPRIAYLISLFQTDPRPPESDTPIPATPRSSFAQAFFNALSRQSHGELRDPNAPASTSQSAPSSPHKSSPHSSFTRVFTPRSGGSPRASVIQSPSPRKGSPRTDFSAGAKRSEKSPRASLSRDSSLRSLVTTELMQSSSSSETVSALEEQACLTQAPPSTSLPQGIRPALKPRRSALPLQTAKTPRVLASAKPLTLDEEDIGDSQKAKDDTLPPRITPPLMLSSASLEDINESRAAAPPIARGNSPIPKLDVLCTKDALIDFSQHQAAFFTSLETHKSTLMRRDVIAEHQILNRAKALPFANIEAECSQSAFIRDAPLPSLKDHKITLLTLFLYMTHNTREFTHRYTGKQEHFKLYHLEPTMLLMTRLHIFALQHQKRIYDTYSALYSLCDQTQKEAFLQHVGVYNASIAEEYAGQSLSRPASLMYHPETAHHTWRNIPQPNLPIFHVRVPVEADEDAPSTQAASTSAQEVPPQAFETVSLLSLSQKRQDLFFEPVKRDPSFYDGPLFCMLLEHDSPFLGILTLFADARTRAKAKEADFEATTSPIMSSSSSSSSPEDPARSKGKKSRGKSTSFHLPTLHFSSPLSVLPGALKLSPRDKHVTPLRESPGHTPRVIPNNHVVSFSDHSSRDSIERTDSDSSGAVSFRAYQPEVGSRGPHDSIVHAEPESHSPSGAPISFRTALREIGARSVSGELEYTNPDRKHARHGTSKSRVSKSTHKKSTAPKVSKAEKKASKKSKSKT